MNWRLEAIGKMRADIENGHLRPAIEAVEENGSKMAREELEAEVGEAPVEELVERKVLTTVRHSGREWVSAQTNMNIWRLPARNPA